MRNDGGRGDRGYGWCRGGRGDAYPRVVLVCVFVGGLPGGGGAQEVSGNEDVNDKYRIC